MSYEELEREGWIRRLGKAGCSVSMHLFSHPYEDPVLDEILAERDHLLYGQGRQLGIG